ncbi:unnamed protein product [Pseudo-nitzschia multistriata]|uniref:Retinoblastoma-associated protein A-box domain-containing protein n=1 Tax=Pseudo-nitzschia multistriata TaxID=183589 RepID=A0A448YXI6_9STRA|nr:unnamed protein product [Pseudo-nitzschia multistriata]
MSADYSKSNVKVMKSKLLSCMKLGAADDLAVNEKLEEWVATQKIPTHISPAQTAACHVSSGLLLQRLVRAFEQRLNFSVDDTKRMKGSTGNSNGNKTATSSGRGTSTTNGSSPKKINTSKAKSKSKPLAEYMQRKVKVTRLVQQALQYVGSDLLKVLQGLAPSPTVADVANTCLQILRDVNRIKEFYTIFCVASGKDHSATDQSSSIFFGVFALQALQCLRAQAICAYEFAHDFEAIYSACYQDRNFQICVHLLNPAVANSPTPATFPPDTEARNICWKIARLLVLTEDFKNKSDPESKDHRRNHILVSATSIILAANMGKSIANNSIRVVGSQVTNEGIIPITEDFVGTVVPPVSHLLEFIANNTTNNDGMTPITSIDIRCHFQNACTMINKLSIMKNATTTVVASRGRSHSILAKAFPPANEYFLLQNYRNILQSLVIQTQKSIKINTANSNQGVTGVSERTGIVNVLLLFPMVIGEPWGIHRDAPMITSRMLCTGKHLKPSDTEKDSVALVVKLKPMPKEIKRKAENTFPDSVPTDNKKAKTFPQSEDPSTPPKKAHVEAIDLVEDDSPTPAPRAPIDMRMGEIEAPVINDATELNEWTLSIISQSMVKPSDMLLSYLGENDKINGNNSSCLENVIVPIINRGALRIQSALRSLSDLGSEATLISIGRRDGQVYVNGRIDEITQLCASVVGFYYHCMEAIIYDKMERMDFLGSFSSVLQSESFHRALLACCLTCVLKGVGTTQKMSSIEKFENATSTVVMNTTECDSFTFLKVIDGLSRALIATGDSRTKQSVCSIVAGLPAIILRHMRALQTQLIDSAIWNSSLGTEKRNESSFVDIIKTMKSLKGAWPPDVLEPLLPEENVNMESNSTKAKSSIRCKAPFGSSSEATFLSFVLRILLNYVLKRITAICAALDLSTEDVVRTQILVAFRYLLRHHISIFNDRHVDQLLLCSVYGVCRVMKIRPEVTFGKIIDAYFTVRGKEQGERICRVIVRHVKLDQPASKRVGNLIVFYNQVYVPKMQKYFIESKSLKENTELYRNKRRKAEELEELQRREQERNKAEERQRKEQQRKEAEERQRKEQQRKEAEERQRKEQQRKEVEERQRKKHQRKVAEELQRKEKERKEAEERQRKEKERKKTEELQRKENERKKTEGLQREENEKKISAELSRKENEQKKTEESQREENEKKAAAKLQRKKNERDKTEELQGTEKMSVMNEITKDVSEKSPATTSPKLQSINRKIVAMDKTVSDAQAMLAKGMIRVSSVENNVPSPIMNSDVQNSTKTNGKASSDITISAVRKGCLSAKTVVPSNKVQNAVVEGSYADATRTNASTNPVSSEPAEKISDIDRDDPKLTKGTVVMSDSSSNDPRLPENRASGSSESEEYIPKGMGSKIMGRTTSTLPNPNSILAGVSKGLQSLVTGRLAQGSSSDEKTLSSASEKIS